MKSMIRPVLSAVLVAVFLCNGANAMTRTIATPESAVKAAKACIDEKKVNVSQHEMTKPESIQKLQVRDRNGWRVSWKLKLKDGQLAVKGGQIVVVVYEDGTCEQGWGE